jgi:hypothetical protein
MAQEEGGTVRADLPTYTYLQAKEAYLVRKEREFLVNPKVPMTPKISTKPCGQFCGQTVHVEHRDSGYLMIRCTLCRAEMNGGLYHIGINEKAPKGKRAFGDLQRWNILRRDGCRCFCCGAGPEQDELEADHIIPFSQGGPTEETNGITLCRSCNQAKTDKIDLDFILRALVHANTTDADRSHDVQSEALWKVVCRVGDILKRWRAAKVA